MEFKLKDFIQQTVEVLFLISLFRVGIIVTMFGSFRLMTITCYGKYKYFIGGGPEIATVFGFLGNYRNLCVQCLH